MILSRLSFMLDVLVSSLSKGRGAAGVTKSDTGVLQFFLCIKAENLDGGEETWRKVLALQGETIP